MAYNWYDDEDNRWNRPEQQDVPTPAGETSPGKGSFSEIAAQILEAKGQGGGGGGGGDDTGPPARPSFNFGKVPRFIAPDFMAPTYEMALQEPGYEFRLGSGRDALERSAAARGVLRTGGTLKDIIEYGQQFGAQEYSNVFNRALQSYGTQYQAAKDEYAPQLAGWLARVAPEQAAGLAAFAQANQGGGGGGGIDPLLLQWLMQSEPQAPQF